MTYLLTLVFCFRLTMYSRINGTQTNILNRTNSICPTPEEKLLELVLSTDTDEIENIINETLLNYLYNDYNKPILLIACIEEKVNAATVETLINSGANLRYSDENQWEALHFAAKRTDVSILTTVINGLKSINCNINSVLAENSNVLHILIRYGDSSKEEFEECAKLLIQNGIDVNHADSKAMSPILWAAKNGLKDIIKIILECSPVPVDLDSHKSRGQTARDIIINKKLYNGILPEKVDNNNHHRNSGSNEESTKEIDALFNYIKSNRENDFINFKNGNISNLVDLDNGNDTLLQLATDKNCKEIVQHLINNGADRLKVTNKHQKSPLEIADDHGFYEIFNILLSNFNSPIPNTVLISLLKYYDNTIFEDTDRSKCFSYLLEKLVHNSNLLDINELDASKNSPLHYAVRYADAPVIKQLLDIGASLGSKNVFNIMPVQDLEPELLEKHLDSCVQFDFKGKKDKEDFEITFNYRTLMPPPKKLDKPDPEQGANDSNNQELVHETEVISYMSTAPEFKHLLVHPVIVSFLFMKWHRIRWLFYTNLAFYVAFFVSLVLYVFSYYANFAEELSRFETFLSNFSWAVLLVTFLS